MHIFHKHFLFSRVHSSVQYISVVTRENTTLAPKTKYFRLLLTVGQAGLQQLLQLEGVDGPPLVTQLEEETLVLLVAYTHTKLGHRLTFYIGGS